MGWSYVHRPKGMSNRDFFTKELCTNLDGEIRHTIVEDGTSGTTVYLAIRDNDAKHPPGKVYGVVVLTARNPHDYFNYGFKVMDEGSGPVASQCPEKVLRALSPSEDLYMNSALDWSKDWRERCHEYNARIAQRGKPKPGDTIVFNEPLKFTDGSKHDQLTLIKGSTFKDENGKGYRIPSWRKRLDWHVAA